MAEASPLKEFLNPKSMITPGIAGGITMMITNALAANFSLPPNYTGLTISFLCGLIVFAGTATVLWLRVVLYLLNSLLIFSMALGVNQTATNVVKTSEKTKVAQSLADRRDVNVAYFSNWLDGTVHKRDSLLATVKSLKETEAAGVLASMGASEQELKDPKRALWGRAAIVRTGEEASGIQAALESVRTMAWQPKPGG